MQFINLTPQWQRLATPIMSRIHQVLAHGQYILGPEVKELEEKLAAYVGVASCISVSSGTDALLAALMCLDIGPGDEVITTPFTFISPAECIRLLGATPVFADIDPATYLISPAAIAAAITPQTKAIIAVSLYGQCCDFTEINQIADRYQIPVIEDAAQSFGACYYQQKSCSLTTLATTSFYPAKPLGCYGDGGAIFTNNLLLAERLRQIRHHGQTRRYEHQRLGLCARLDTLQAAILLEKLNIFDEELHLRHQVAMKYQQELEGWVKLPYLAPQHTSAFAQYTIATPHREQVVNALHDNHIPTAIHYPQPLHRQPVFADLNLPEGAFPYAEAAAKQVLSLPMSPYLTAEEQVHIIDTLKQTLRLCVEEAVE